MEKRSLGLSRKMIDANSNCSRVDSVKALASQLRLQAAPKSSPVAGTGQTSGDSPSPQKISSDFQNVDAAVKADDAKKAELALATVKKDLTAAQVSQQSNADSTGTGGRRPFRGLDVVA